MLAWHKEPLRLDYLINARAVPSMVGGTCRSAGLCGAEIVAVSAEPDGLEHLATGASRWSMPVI